MNLCLRSIMDINFLGLSFMYSMALRSSGQSFSCTARITAYCLTFVLWVGLAKQPFHSSDQRHRGFILLLSNEIDDAAGRVREQVGDEATRRKRMMRDIQQGHDNEMKMVMEKCATQILLP